MNLSSDLVSQFAKITNDTTTKKESIVYGKVVKYNDSYYVKIDGSEILTPVTSTIAISDGERVSVMIKNHTAIVTGNISAPAARTDDVNVVDGKVTELDTKVTKLGTVVADKVSTKELEAQVGRIDTLVSDNVTIKNRLTASEGYISDLTADNVAINKKLTANEADISKIKTDKLDASAAEITYATIKNLEATNAEVYNFKATYGEFKDLTTDKLSANEADINNLKANKLDASTAEITYATIANLNAANAEITSLKADKASIAELEAGYAKIDLANVSNAWIQNGIIKDGSIGEAAIHEGAITNAKIADATIEAAKIKSINADNITTGTLKTERLIITDDDGNESIVKAINVANGVAEANSKKIQAASIEVADLSAFEAKIAQFNMSGNAIYSGKTSITDPTSGIYISTTGIGAGNGSLVGSNESPVQIYADGGMKLKGKNGCIDFNTVTGELSIDASSLKVGSKTVASNEDVTDAVNNIEIGGRNLILNSDVWSSSGSTSTGVTASREDGVLKVISASGNGNWQSFPRENVIEANLNEGDAFTFSIEIKSEDGTKPPAIYFKSGMGYYGFTGSVSTDYSWVYYTGIWKKTNPIQFHFGWRQAIGTYYIRKIKLEKGNKATDWTPAPEDFNSDIDALETRVASAETSIEQNSTAISLRATKTEVSTAKSEAISAAATDATTKANAAKTDAVNAASTDATTKANKAKTDAISAAATDATTKADQALADAKTYADAQIKVSADSITSTVSNTYQTKSGMSNYLTTATAANTYSKKQLPDTRNDNQPPSWYMTNYPRQVITEFKFCSTIGLISPGETYCTLETTVPWNDKSGGYPKQRAQAAGKVYYRIGTSESTWGLWKNTLDTATADSSYASNESLNALTENVNTYIESSTSMIQDINGWQYNWNKILKTDDANVAEHQDYITFQNGDIILGESASDLKVKVGNDAIQFKGSSETEVTPDSDATAWITGQQFNINEGEIHTSLKVGRLRFMPRPNGNFSIAIV